MEGGGGGLGARASFYIPTDCSCVCCLRSGAVQLVCHEVRRRSFFTWTWSRATEEARSLILVRIMYRSAVPGPGTYFSPSLGGPASHHLLRLPHHPPLCPWGCSIDCTAPLLLLLTCRWDPLRLRLIQGAPCRKTCCSTLWSECPLAGQRDRVSYGRVLSPWGGTPLAPALLAFRYGGRPN